MAAEYRVRGMEPYIGITVSRKLFQYSDWILKRILYVFQPKESDYEVKNIQKIRDRGPYWPGMSIFAIFAFFEAVFGPLKGPTCTQCIQMFV